MRICDFATSTWLAVEMTVTLITIQIIKTSVSDGIHGDLVPPDVLEVAAALYHLRIPSRWLQLAGDSSPPGSWSLTAWLTDLQSRHAHIERVVTQVCCYNFIYTG
jgi:hypothetical protein